ALDAVAQDAHPVFGLVVLGDAAFGGGQVWRVDEPDGLGVNHGAAAEVGAVAIAVVAAHDVVDEVLAAFKGVFVALRDFNRVSLDLVGLTQRVAGTDIEPAENQRQQPDEAHASEQRKPLDQAHLLLSVRHLSAPCLESTAQTYSPRAERYNLRES